MTRTIVSSFYWRASHHAYQFLVCETNERVEEYLSQKQPFSWRHSMSSVAIFPPDLNRLFKLILIYELHVHFKATETYTHTLCVVHMYVYG